MNLEEAQKKALEAAVDSYRQSIEVVPVDAVRGSVYNFNPEGWMIFAIMIRRSPQLGGTRYIAVHQGTGEVRDLGIIGA